MKDHFVLLLVFYLLLLLGVVLFFLWLIDKRNKRKLQLLRSDWANRLHSDIGGNLSSVKLLLELIRQSPEEPIREHAEDLNIAMDTLQESIHKLRFVIDIVDQRKDSLQVVLDNLIHFYQNNFAAVGIQFTVNRPAEPLPKGQIDIVRVNKLYLLIKEVLNNCLRHSQAKRVSFTQRQESEFLLIEIKDDGIGFDINEQFKGNGLKDLREHSEAGSLIIEIQSEPGQGTEVSIKIYY